MARDSDVQVAPIECRTSSLAAVCEFCWMRELLSYGPNGGDNYLLAWLITCTRSLVAKPRLRFSGQSDNTNQPTGYGSERQATGTLLMSFALVEAGDTYSEDKVVETGRMTHFTMLKGTVNFNGMDEVNVDCIEDTFLAQVSQIFPTHCTMTCSKCYACRRQLRPVI